MSSGPNIVAISVGNTRTQAGLFVDGALVETARLGNDQLAALVEQIVEWWQRIADTPAAAVLASVNDAIADQIDSLLKDQLSTDVYRIGTDLPAPIGRELDPETITGVDRLLNAAAAYDTVQQACVVVDVGTAVTVDFVDGEGTFHGGAIAPGARMQLRALHEYTSNLPDLEFVAPKKEAFGKSTAEAMYQGVFHGIRGLVWRLVEQYAERYGAFPLVIATGGDAEVLFRNDELVDRIVPDLTLLGIAVAARHALAAHRNDD